MGDRSAVQALADVDGAHAALMKQPDLQFHLPMLMVSKPSPLALAVLKALAAVFRFVGPVAPYIFWGGLILGLLGVAYLLLPSRFKIRPGARAGHVIGTEAAWRPAPEQARALLEEADRLAQEGLFEAAAHLILLRSVEDIAARRPKAVQPSLTSRDIAALPALTPMARETFSGIAMAVERSLFGGRPMGRDGFLQCRDAYQALAAASSWT